MRTLSQNCEQTLQKLRTNRIMNKRAFLINDHFCICAVCVCVFLFSFVFSGANPKWGILYLGRCPSTVLRVALGRALIYEGNGTALGTNPNRTKPYSRPAQTVLGKSRNRTRSVLGQRHVSFPSPWGSQEKFVEN